VPHLILEKLLLSLGSLALGLAPRAKPPVLFSKLENQAIIEMHRKFWRGGYF
jgi:hypothetical protein